MDCQQWTLFWLCCVVTILCTESSWPSGTSMRTSSFDADKVTRETCNRHNTMPYFVKLHKVGSEGIARSLGIGFRNVRGYHNTSCTDGGGGPFSHDIALTYGMHGRAKVQACNVMTLCTTLIIVLRNPLERLMSQLHFYSVWNSLIQNHISTLDNKEEVSAAHAKFLAQSKDISPHEMHVLLQALRQFERLDLQPNMYELVLSQKYNHSDPSLSNHTLQVALHNLRVDFDVVGTTEQMESMFALMSRVINIKLTDTCVSIMSQGMKREYKRKYKSLVRPRASELLSTKTFAFLQHELRGDILLWETASRIHQNMIEKYSDTSVATAKQLYEKTCPKLHMYPRNASKWKNK
mmetsp:Transcript_18570/g.30950  ORF Transcript_18570/g.30950 Transcript_18570/m.30950 type:complete len:350 (-) Transcript_18570:115-1164(-)